MSAKQSDRTYLRQDEKDVLKSMLEEWSSQADKNSRDAFISGTVIPKIQQLNLVEFGSEIIEKDKLVRIKWEKRVSAVHTWFKNHKPFKDRQVFKLERKIPLRRVVGKLKAAEIENIIKDKNPDLPKGDKSYPGIYQQAVTEYMAQMSDEEEQEMQSALQDWQSEGPPMEVRLKAAKKYGRRAIINAHQLLEKEMYISCITVSMVPDVDTGAIGVTCHDYIADAHSQRQGKRFKTFSEWSGPKYNLFIQQMIDYANYVKEQRSEVCEQGGGTGTEPVTFEAGPGDLPLLPPPVLGVRSEETAKTAKEIVRAFFLRHYQLAVGSDSAKTPWAQIGEHPSNFFDLECIPTEFKISDPSRMGVNVKTLLSHLRQRQADHGVQGFQFRQVLRNGVLEPASYPEEAKMVLEPEPTADTEMIKQSEEPKSPVKGKKVPKVKTPRKSKSPKKAKGPSKSVKTEDSMLAVEANLPITVEAVDLPMQNIPSLHPVPEAVPPLSKPSTMSNAPTPNSAPQIFSFDTTSKAPAQYDPVLFPDNTKTGPPEEQHAGTNPPVLPPNFGSAYPPPPHFHQTQFPDHRYAMIQQMLSQWAMAPPWSAAFGPQYSQQTSDPPPHGFYQPTPPSGPVLNPFPTTLGPLESHPIPYGEPPFAPVRLPIPPPLVPLPMQHHVMASIAQSPKSTPKKRKFKPEEQDSPSKKPTRSSNRTKSPKKEKV